MKKKREKLKALVFCGSERVIYALYVGRCPLSSPHATLVVSQGGGLGRGLPGRASEKMPNFKKLYYKPTERDGYMH